MSPIFILIWIVLHGPGGVATGAQEFTNLEQCQKAAKLWDTSDVVVVTRCVRK